MHIEADPRKSLADPATLRRVIVAYDDIVDFIVRNSDKESNLNSDNFDLVVVAGSSRLEVSRYAAQTFKEAPFIIFSGKNGERTKDWGITEGYAFKRLFEVRNPFSKVVESEDESRNCDENYLNSLRKAKRLLKYPIKDLAICCHTLVRLRFSLLHQKHEEANKLVIFSPPQWDIEKLYRLDRIEDVLWHLTTAIGEIPRWEWMRSHDPDKIKVNIPSRLFEHKVFYDSLGIKARPVATMRLFSK